VRRLRHHLTRRGLAFNAGTLALALIHGENHNGGASGPDPVAAQALAAVAGDLANAALLAMMLFKMAAGMVVAFATLAL
jgi:hypothetical protein